MRIGVLCNSILAIPAIQLMQNNKLLVAIGVPDVVVDDTPELENFFTSINIKASQFDSKGFANGVKRWISNNNIDVVFVITFPWKIPAHILSIPKLGFFNFHFALLPAYRGASPVFWQIRNGELFGGLTIHRMDSGWDTGAIAHIHKVAMLPGETFGMHNRRIGWETLQGVAGFIQKLMLLGNAIPLSAQNPDEAHYYPRPSAKDIAIDWATMTASEIFNLVNACNPWNKGAYTMCGNSVFKIVQLSIKEQLNVYNQQLIPGSVINCSVNKTIEVITVDNKVVVVEVISIDEGIFTADFLVKQGLKENQLLVKPF